VFTLLFSGNLSAQTEDLSNVRVDELTEVQLRKFVIEANRIGLSEMDIEQFALQNGMNQIEVVKLKERIRAIRKSESDKSPGIIPPSSPVNKLQDSIESVEKRPLFDFNQVFSTLKSRNFGYEVFNNARIVFEPDLNIPAPRNYILAANDELVVEVTGNSEATYRLKISPEGKIKIPVAGIVSVNGKTIEQAKSAIIKRLSSTIYSSIKTGRTNVDVTLGAIRSIRVTVIGEATMPGTYTLPSVASVFHALYACGGPGDNGSYRNIQLIRNNKPIAVVDIYEYLITGSKANDIILMDQDVVKINTYDSRVELKGEIKKPGLYDVIEGETLKTIIGYAGGFTENAYRASIQVFRNTTKERKLTTALEKDLATLIPEKADVYIISKILNRFSNRISINGAVYRPGEFELKEGMTVLDLIKEADGIREDAFMGRASIHRLKADLSPEIFSFDVDKLLSGNANDIRLHKEDRVVIYSKFDLKEGYYVKLNGEVSSPGVFLYEEGMKVQDLILMAGGLKESSSLKRIEISRRIKDTSTVKSVESQTALIFQEEIRSDLKDSSIFKEILLMPFDEVVIRPAPGYFVQKNVVVEGEVHYTGKYTLEAKKDRISDLVKRSGGLTEDAYLNGAVLVRTRNFSNTEQSNYESGLKNLIRQNIDAGTPQGRLQLQVSDIIQRKSDFVGIDLEKIMKKPGSEYDLFLNDGDTLRIPKQLQTVRVSGEVLYPTLVRFQKEYKFKDYVLGAGGFAERSARKRSYVVYSNGSVAGTTHFLFIKNYPSISPGSEIYVPLKRERMRLSTGEVIAISATLVSMLAILVNLLK
jgi:protein involved in polysaccharide export with SLBB domain